MCGCAALAQLHVASLSTSQLSLRCRVWDGCSALSTGASVRLSASLSSASFPLSVSAVSFVSAVAWCLAELDSEYGLVVPSSASSPSQFASNAFLHPSQQFATYVELPSVAECGSFTEFVQWRRRVCELRAKGWGYSFRDGAGGEPTERELPASASPSAASQWRLDRLNAIARDQSRKNFTPFNATSDSSSSGDGDGDGLAAIAQLCARLLKETESKGVQLLLGNAPPQLGPPLSPSPAEPTVTAVSDAHLSASCAALVRFLCVLFGSLRRGGDFAFLLTGADRLLPSPLLQSVLRTLSGCFALLDLHQCAASVGAYGSSEVWLVGKSFTAGHAEESNERLLVACSQLLTETRHSDRAATSLLTLSLQSAALATTDNQSDGPLPFKLHAMHNRFAHSTKPPTAIQSPYIATVTPSLHVLLCRVVLCCVLCCCVTACYCARCTTMPACV